MAPPLGRDGRPMSSSPLLPPRDTLNFAVGGDVEERLAARLARRQSMRHAWGRFADTRPMRFARQALPFALIVSTVMAMAFPVQIDEISIAATFAFAILVLQTPSVAAAGYAYLVGKDQLRKGTRGGRHHEARPGAERIENTLKEAFIHEGLRIGNLLSVSGLLAISAMFEDGNEIRGALLLGGVLLGSVNVVHTLLQERQRPRHAHHLPFLQLHAPSQHEAQLNYLLTELLEAHLDPESAMLFEAWKSDFEAVLQSGARPGISLERFLHLLHLEGEDLIRREVTLREMAEFIRPDLLQPFLHENPHLRLHTMLRLMGHTRAWQRGLFRLLDRLQYDLMDHTEAIANADWRLDLSLPDRCSNSQGDLFLLVNNLGSIDAPVELEIQVPEGQPARQTFRLTPRAVQSPSWSLPLHADAQDDVIHWLSRLTDAGSALWVGLAWEEGVKGRRPVSVTLREVDGKTIQSVTAWTEVARRSSGSESVMRRMQFAQALGRSWHIEAIARGR